VWQAWLRPVGTINGPRTVKLKETNELLLRRLSYSQADARYSIRMRRVRMEMLVLPTMKKRKVRLVVATLGLETNWLGVVQR
jgi:hypothetical protein